MTKEWKLVKKKLSELREYDKNPRRLTKEQYEQLCVSLDKFGVIDKPIITPDGMVIGGHQRLRALEDLGYQSIECWVPDSDLTDKEIEELNIRLNKNGGEFDFEILANQFETEDLIKWGFSELEFGSIDEIPQSDQEGDDDDEKKKKECPACGHKF